MSAWTHNICGECWNKQNPQRPLTPERAGRGEIDTCCFCGKRNSDGVYIRQDRKPPFYFCGWPVPLIPGADPNKRQLWGACEAIATPGCAFCDRHAKEYDAERKINKPLTADEIVERVAARHRRETRTVLYLAVVAAVFMSGYLARHWLRSHPEFFFVACGVFIGSVAEGIVWGRWRWNKGDRPC